MPIKRDALEGTHIPLGSSPSCDSFCLRFWVTAGGVFREAEVVKEIKEWHVSYHPYFYTLKRLPHSQAEGTRLEIVLMCCSELPSQQSAHNLKSPHPLLALLPWHTRGGSLPKVGVTLLLPHLVCRDCLVRVAVGFSSASSQLNPSSGHLSYKPYTYLHMMGLERWLSRRPLTTSELWLGSQHPHGG